jgi:hypothetical protein
MHAATLGQSAASLQLTNQRKGAGMSERVIYVFECDDGEHFAITHDLDNLRREVKGFGKYG